MTEEWIQQSLFDRGELAALTASMPEPLRNKPNHENWLKEIVALFAAALEIKGSAAFQRYLNSMCRMRHLSIFNAMLAQAQRPGVGEIATRDQWFHTGRRVLPGAIPIVILQPYGPVAFLYEFKDTDGPIIDTPESYLFMATGVVSENQWQRLVRKAAHLGVDVTLTAFGAHLAGTAHSLVERPGRRSDAAAWLVRINSSFDLPTRVATLAHELGHIYCGHCGASPTSRWQSRELLTEEKRELEAETVAWLVCRRMNLAARSPEYLSQLARPDSLRQISGEDSLLSIFRAVNWIESEHVPRV